jgi:hypothetical protein
VRVQVHTGVEQRLTQTRQTATRMLGREVVRDVFGLVGGEHDSLARDLPIGWKKFYMLVMSIQINFHMRD